MFFFSSIGSVTHLISCKLWFVFSLNCLYIETSICGNMPGLANSLELGNHILNRIYDELLICIECGFLVEEMVRQGSLQVMGGAADLVLKVLNVFTSQCKCFSQLTPCFYTV